MAFSILWTFLVAGALLFGAYSGHLDAVSGAALEGASAAVELCIAMAGAMALWSGVMELLRATGLADGLARLFRPALRRLFPEASQDAETLSALSANVTANLLGLGNAATPLGIRAAERMARESPGRASDELCRLVVLNTASIQLFPATVASLRSAAGCQTPLDILPAIWLTSAASVTVGLCAERLLSRAGTERRLERPGKRAGTKRALPHVERPRNPAGGATA